jgi:nitroreductase
MSLTANAPSASGSARRQSEYDVAPLFLDRWSPRAYTGEPIPDAVLFTLFDAARWAPSGSNDQPWRFLYAKRDSADWPKFCDLLAPVNQRWATQASVLVMLVSKRVKIGRDGVAVPARSHSFDTGAAWQNLALQAHLLGWGTRAIGGYNRDQARVVLNVPDDFALEAAVAIGKPGDKTLLSAELQEREVPSGRQPLKDLVIAGGFPAASLAAGRP